MNLGVAVMDRRRRSGRNPGSVIAAVNLSGAPASRCASSHTVSPATCPARRSPAASRCAESKTATASARPEAPASHLAISSTSVVTCAGRSAERTHVGRTVGSEHTASTWSVGQPACQAAMVWAASGIDGTSTAVTPSPASLAAARDATNVLPVPQAMISCLRPPPASPDTMASTASAW